MVLASSPSKSSPVSTSRVKVCVVDTNFGGYGHLLADRNLRGVQWELITSARDALRQMQRDTVTLWVINIQLPDISGAELCQMIKSQSPSAVVWLLTDDYRPEDERAAWLAGATMFRPKPIDPVWFERITQRQALAPAM
jgi:DNA-binding response OmpR family regulator